MIDESAHKVFDYGMKDWHDFRTHKCSHCSRQLDIYYCESRLYLVRCKHCKIVSLVEAGNPNEAAEKVSRRAAPENKPLTLEQLREMDGEPVWVKEIDGTGCGEWTIIDIGAQTEMLKALSPDTGYKEYNYGKTWLAYAREPEGSENNE